MGGVEVDHLKVNTEVTEGSRLNERDKLLNTPATNAFQRRPLFFGNGGAGG